MYIPHSWNYHSLVSLAHFEWLRWGPDTPSHWSQDKYARSKHKHKLSFKDVGVVFVTIGQVRFLPYNGWFTHHFAMRTSMAALCTPRTSAFLVPTWLQVFSNFNEQKTRQPFHSIEVFSTHSIVKFVVSHRYPCLGWLQSPYINSPSTLLHGTHKSAVTSTSDNSNMIGSW